MSGGRWSQAEMRRLARKRAPHRGGWRVTGRPRRPARWRRYLAAMFFVPALRRRYGDDWKMLLAGYLCLAGACIFNITTLLAH